MSLQSPSVDFPEPYGSSYLNTLNVLFGRLGLLQEERDPELQLSRASAYGALLEELPSYR